jgi:hypothetical protein
MKMAHPPESACGAPGSSPGQAFPRGDNVVVGETPTTAFPTGLRRGRRGRLLRGASKQ